jgi:hypothetical protein
MSLDQGQNLKRIAIIVPTGLGQNHIGLDQEQMNLVLSQKIKSIENTGLGQSHTGLDLGQDPMNHMLGQKTGPTGHPASHLTDQTGQLFPRTTQLGSHRLIKLRTNFLCQKHVSNCCQYEPRLAEMGLTVKMTIEETQHKDDVIIDM